MNQHMREVYKDRTNYRSEAQYYLEVTDYNLAAAIKEFEEDLKFENEQEAKFKGA